MKARGRLLVLICVVALLSALPAAASAAAGKTHDLEIGTIELEGSNGYEIEVGIFGEDEKSSFVAASATNGPLRANYDVRAERAPGIHATFGSLGQLDVGFK